jgi:pimeloyl-ACP methyl ester carboxylesterase
MGVIEAEELSQVVLAVHSYAGMIGTAVADRMGERLAHLVYVDAVVPRPGESWMKARALFLWSALVSRDIPGTCSGPQKW